MGKISEILSRHQLSATVGTLADEYTRHLATEEMDNKAVRGELVRSKEESLPNTVSIGYGPDYDIEMNSDSLHKSSKQYGQQTL